MDLVKIIVIITLILVILLLISNVFIIFNLSGSRASIEFFNGIEEGVTPVPVTTTSASTSTTTTKNFVITTTTPSRRLIPGSDQAREYFGNKYFGTVFITPPTCSSNVITPLVSDPTAGNIPKYLFMLKRLYKVNKPGFDEYIMLDDFDYQKNKVKLYKNSYNSATGSQATTVTCLDIDFKSPLKLDTLIQKSGEAIIQGPSFLYSDGQYSMIERNKTRLLTEQFS